MLTVLQERLAEAHALAIAATAVTAKVAERLGNPSLVRELEGMRRDAEETRSRCLAAERAFGEEVAGELLAHANTVAGKAADLAGAWFKAGTGPVAAWSFLAMSEAGEVATWATLGELAMRSSADGVTELAAWGLPVQERHLGIALDGAVLLGRLDDPEAPRWG
jgi:hypothetical protein